MEAHTMGKRMMFMLENVEHGLIREIMLTAQNGSFASPIMIVLHPLVVASPIIPSLATLLTTITAEILGLLDI